MTVKERINMWGLSPKEAELYAIMESTYIGDRIGSKIDKDVFEETMSLMRDLNKKDRKKDSNKAYNRDTAEFIGDKSNTSNNVIELSDYMNSVYREDKILEA